LILVVCPNVLAEYGLRPPVRLKVKCSKAFHLCVPQLSDPYALSDHANSCHSIAGSCLVAPTEGCTPNVRGGLIRLWLYKENKKLRDLKKMYLLYIFSPRAPHTHNFVVLTSLTHPRKPLLVVLQIGKAKDLSAPLRITGETSFP
jgi:hypothetical protein